LEIQIGRVTFAPADSGGNRWDSLDADLQWRELLVEWSDLSTTISTKGAFRRGSYEDVETVNEYFETTLFGEAGATDPLVVLYSSDDGGASWGIAQAWEQLRGNTYQLDGLYLGRWALDDDVLLNLSFLDVDAPEETRVDDLMITSELAQSIANCGPMSLVLSELEMASLDSRVHAIEIEVQVVDWSEAGGSFASCTAPTSLSRTAHVRLYRNIACWELSPIQTTPSLPNSESAPIRWNTTPRSVEA
jgi:hypothetical protein